LITEEMQPKRKLLTVDEYLAAERDAGMRHEYLNGELVGYAGCVQYYCALVRGQKSQMFFNIR